MGVQVEDLVFEVRDASLNRVAQLLPTDGLTSFKATLRFNNVGTWEISIPESSPRADLLRTPGYGLIVTGPGGVVWLSGPTVAATNTRDMGLPFGDWAIRGATDSILLGERLAYPTPGSANVAAQTSAYDTRTGTASTVMYGYVTRNLVSGTAPAARVVSGLTCATDTAVGSSVSFSARFDNLGELLSSLANVSSPQLGFDVKQSGAGLQFAVYQPTDRTGTIRMDADNKTLQKATYGYGYGKTRAIVGGNGEGTARQFVEVSSSTAESTWSRRVEAFVDQRQESDSTKLTQAGTDLLNQSGGTITSMDVVPTNDTTMTYGTDFYLGDKVTVAVAAQQVTGIVSTVQVSVAEDGVRVGCTIGNPVGFDYEAVLSKRQVDTTAGVSALQRVEAVQGTLVPAAGSTGQALVKTSGADYATAWGQVSSAGVADGAVIAGKISAGTIVNADVSASAAIAMSKISGALPIAQGGTGFTTGAGLGLVIPTSVAVTGTGSSGSVDATGLVTFASATSISLNGCFSATYTNYFVVLNLGTVTSATTATLGFRQSGSTDTTANYTWRFGSTTSASVFSGTYNAGQTSIGRIVRVDTNGGALMMNIFKPFAAASTLLLASATDTAGSNENYGATFNTTKSFDGFTITPSANTFTGTMRVYGYNN